MTYVKVKKERLDKVAEGLGDILEEAEKAQAYIDQALRANRQGRNSMPSSAALASSATS